MAEGGFGEVAALALVPSSVRHLHPEEVVWEAMLTGWAAQMRARALSLSTRGRLSCWAGGSLGRHCGATRTGLRLFCDYLVDARYGWGERCFELFGTHPIQVCHE